VASIYSCDGKELTRCLSVGELFDGVLMDRSFRGEFCTLSVLNDSSVFAPCGTGFEIERQTQLA